MQQTNQYQYNLIEPGDTFSPAPLNENAEIMEAALREQAQAIQENADEMEQVKSAMVNCAAGSYTGTGSYGSGGRNTLAFEFVPKLVLVMGGGYFSLFIQGGTQAMGSQSAVGAYHVLQRVSWSENTLSWHIDKMYSSSGEYSGSAASQMNTSGTTYYYLAIG